MPHFKGAEVVAVGGGSGVEAREGRKRKICGSRRSREGENET